MIKKMIKKKKNKVQKTSLPLSTDNKIKGGGEDMQRNKDGYLISNYVYMQPQKIEGKILKNVCLAMIDDDLDSVFLQNLVEKINLKKEGIKVRYMPFLTYPILKKDPGIFLGKITDIRLQDGYVMGNLHLSGTASTTKGQNICDHIIKTTELTTEMLGLCVVFKGQKYQKGYNKKEYKKLSTNKKTYLELEKLHCIYCYDFRHIEEKK